MKAFSLTLILLTGIVWNACADNFQFFYQSGSNFFYAAYEQVKLYDARNNLVFSGYTDKFGRIAIRTNPGSYACRVTYRKTEYSASLTIRNNSVMSKVYFGRAMRPYIMRTGFTGS